MMAFRWLANPMEQGKKLPDEGSPAFVCRVCWQTAKVTDKAEWRIHRRGDAVVSWACNLHLAEECHRLQRDFEVTELVVRWTP